MPVIQSNNGPSCRIRLQGELGLQDAADLKRALLTWLSEGKDLKLDLSSAAEIDTSLLQLLAAATQEAAQRDLHIFADAPDALCSAARDTGFDQIPGFPIQGQRHA